MKISVRNLVSSLLLSYTITSQAISPAVLDTLTVASAIAPASMVYKMFSEKGKFRAGIMASVSGVITSMGSRWWLYKFTACGKIERAECIMRTIKKYLLVRESFDTDEELSQAITDLYLYQEWPLVTAYNDLLEHRELSLEAINIAQDAQQEDVIYTVRAERVKNVMNNAVDTINRAIKCIRAHPDFTQQLGKFREMQHQKDVLRAEKYALLARWANVILQAFDVWLQWNQAAMQQQIQQQTQQQNESHSQSHESDPQTTTQETGGETEPAYLSDACCICLENFGTVTRIILRPCAHDMCKSCANELFFVTKQSKICPLCRANVDLNRLKADLKSNSAASGKIINDF